MDKKRKFAIIVLAASVLLLAAVLGYNYLSENYVPEETENSSEPEKTPAPDFTVYDAEGNPVNLSDFSGKPVVINFWATWCGFCVKEMPAFEKAAQEYGDEVVFMMINVTDGQSETKESAMEFIEENGYTFPVYYDTDLSATNVYGAYSLPATGFISSEGIFIGGQMGAMSEETLFSYIEKLLETE